MNLCTHPDAVRWNPDNGVVQCHVCDHVWVPLDAEKGEHYKLRVEAEQARLHDAKPTSPCTGCSDDCFHCSKSPASVPAKSAGELMRDATHPQACDNPWCELCYGPNPRIAGV